MQWGHLLRNHNWAGTWEPIIATAISSIFFIVLSPEGKQLVGFFELCGAYRLKPLTEVDIYPAINGLTSLGKGVAFLIILVKKVVYPKIQAQ